MLNSDGIKIAVLGDTLSSERLCFTVSDSAVSLTYLTKTLDVVDLLKREHFDIIVIDSLYDKGQLACHSLAAISGTPIALLVNDRDTNWEKICYWEVDGFIPEQSGQIEIIARIKAISRRKLYRPPVTKV